jgi:hypothetical protein
MTSTDSDAKSFEFEKDLLRRFFKGHQSSWRIAVASLAMVHVKHRAIYGHSKGHKAGVINNKLKNCFGATASPYQQLLTGADN